jgi:hypothetical protein
LFRAPLSKPRGFESHQARHLVYSASMRFGQPSVVQ